MKPGRATGIFRRPGAWSALLGAYVMVLLAIIPVGAFAGFPVMDDGELLTMFRELGRAPVGPANRDRPINGWLLQNSVGLFGEHRAAWIAIAVCLWALLAWQSSRLVRRLLSSSRSLEWVAALLVISPLVVEMQFTTLTFVFPGNLPVSIALESILLALGRGPDRPPGRLRLLTAAVLATASVSISEYGLATIAAGFALLIVLRQHRPAASLMAGGTLGWIVMRAIADPGARPETAPALQLAHFLARLQLVPLRLFSGAWCSLLGAYGSALTVPRLPAAYTALAMATGVVGAFVAARAISTEAPPERDHSRTQVAIGLLAATTAGLALVVLADRDPSWPGFDSRFRLPILPFAVALTLYVGQQAAVGRWRWLPAALLAYAAGTSMIAGALDVRRDQRAYTSLGKLVRPSVQMADGLTVIVVSDRTYAIRPAKLAYDWNLEDERRVWVLRDDWAADTFGPRSACHDTDRLHIPRLLKRVGRDGPIAQVLWAGRPREPQIEPYCLGPTP